MPMPRKPRYFHPELVEAKPQLVCRLCKYQWTPNPKLWKNESVVMMKGKLAKMITCPNCGKRNYITIEDIDSLIRWYEMNAENSFARSR
jgi:hypothetical protein